MKNVWLIGTGGIGVEYSKVLDALNIEHTIIGRGENSAMKFEDARPGKQVVRGGVDDFLSTKPDIPDGAIVAVGIHDLFNVSQQLIKFGIKRLFIEKPGADNFEKVIELNHIAEQNHAKCFLAYNRRFYSSILKAEEIINEDGGITSFHFEFTEWLHVFKQLYDDKISLNEIFFCNSTHVLDTAFFLGGDPVEMNCYTHTLEGDDFPQIFAGAGRTSKGALFSYQANWDAPGRWVVEVLTKKHRLYFKPMETLQIQELKSVRVNPVEIDDHLDKEFKPGFFLETKAFVEEDDIRLCSLEYQAKRMDFVLKKMSSFF